MFKAAPAGLPHPSCWSRKRCRCVQRTCSCTAPHVGHQGDIAGAAPCCFRRKALAFVQPRFHTALHVALTRVWLQAAQVQPLAALPAHARAKLGTPLALLPLGCLLQQRTRVVQAAQGLTAKGGQLWWVARPPPADPDSSCPAACTATACPHARPNSPRDSDCKPPVTAHR